MKTSTLLGLLIVLTIIAGLLLSLSHIAKQQRILNISSYDECVKAGYPIMESYPSQCATPDGRTFVNPAEHVDQTPPQTSQPVVANGCAVGGCSDEVCGEASDAPMVSNCIYKPEFACYKQASCDRQANGKCGWTPSPSLSACIAASASSTATVQ